MSERNRERWQLEALRACLRDLGGDRGLDVGDQIRLVAALFAQLQDAGRAVGLDEGSLIRLRSEGESLAQAESAARASAADPANPEGALPPPPSFGDDAMLPSLESGAETPLATAPLGGAQAGPAVDDPFALLDQAVAPDESGPVDASEIGLELVPVVEHSEESAIAPGSVRRAPRYTVRTEVLVMIDGRDRLSTETLRDISVGGLFLMMNDPPARGTMMRVTVSTASGPLELYGKAVRVITTDEAIALRLDPGVGIQFTGLDDKRREILEQHVQGVAVQLDAKADAEPLAQIAEAGARVRSFINYIDSSRLYDAIGVAPDASLEEIEAAIQELNTILAAGAATCPDIPEAQRHGSIAALERISKILTVSSRRLAHDFAHGHVRAQERLAECRAAGKKPESLRAIWHSVFPEQLRQAQSLVGRAGARAREHDYEEAFRMASEALNFDPFNELLREKVSRWDVMRVVANECRDGSLDAEARLAWASSMGVNSETLRGVWRSARPEESAKAEKLTRRVASAIRVGQRGEAFAAAREALALDPFNEQLRTALAQLR